MAFEVESKHPLTSRPEVEEAIRVLAGTSKGFAAERVEQIDRYLRHPSRNFAETDEALRIRSVGNRHAITYKGPKIGSGAKARREIELHLTDNPETLADWLLLWESLGFTHVAEVKKVRRVYRFAWGDRDWEAAFDSVAGLGEFLELETIAEEQEVPAAQAAAAALATLLQLPPAEPRSYLEMVLAAAGKC